MNQLLHRIPNGLSVARIGLGLIFPLVPVGWRPWVVALAAATDLIDGYAARRLHAESATGRFLDPIADKIFVLMIAGTLVAEGAISLVWAVGIAARDLVVSVGAVGVMVVTGREALRQMRPTWLGKGATVAQLVVLFVAVMWLGVPVWMLAATTTLSVAAATGYVLAFLRSRHSLSKLVQPTEPSSAPDHSGM